MNLLSIFRKEKNESNNVLKGEKFELELKKYLDNTIDVYYKLLHNVNIMINEKNAQIDLLLITYSGIYVIESKNWSGIIYGDIYDSNWRQFIPYTHKTNYYKNPVNQNSYHINILSKYLNIDRNLFKSFIIFNNETKLKLTKSVLIDVNIIKSKDLVTCILKDLKYSPILLQYEQIDKIYTLLKYMHIKKE